MNDKNKFSTMIIDGQIVDLNSISYEKMDEIQAKLEKKQEEIRDKIDKILDER
jgi:hypothetical protein